MRPESEFLDREPYEAALARARRALGEKSLAMDTSSMFADCTIKWVLVTDGVIEDDRQPEAWQGIVRTTGHWSKLWSGCSPAEAVEHTLREHQETLGFVRLHQPGWREGPGWPDREAA